MKHKLLIVPMILALAGAGCGGSGSVSGSATPTTPSGSSDSGMAGSGAAVAGGCSNAYYPFKVGSKITYKSTSASTNSSYTMEVQPGSTADSHKLVYTFTASGHTVPVTQEFTCDSSGIHANGQLDLATALGGAQFSYQTDSVDGPFLPANMSVGTNWETTYNVTVHTSNSVLAARIDGKHQSTNIKSSVIGEEDVTVPAGTYHALKVKMDITINSELIGTPVQTTTETWFVKNIGMVKSVSTSNGVESTTEATAVTGF